MTSRPSSRPLYVPPAKRRQQGRSSTGDKNANTVALNYSVNHGKNKRPPRFHGAFTGGFSAGYFNTVGSKEGWKPSEDARREQRLEDFMDEQDHEEWGGPTTVRRDYAAETQGKTHGFSSEGETSRGQGALGALVLKEDKEPERPANSTFALDRLFHVSHQTVGPRLAPC